MSNQIVTVYCPASLYGINQLKGVVVIKYDLTLRKPNPPAKTSVNVLRYG